MNSTLKTILYMEVQIKTSFFFHLLSFSGFQLHFIIYTDLIHTAASGTLTDDVMHRLFNKLIPAYNILVLLLRSNLVEKPSLINKI